jgi:hypothetical protein
MRCWGKELSRAQALYKVCARKPGFHLLPITLLFLYFFARFIVQVFAALPIVIQRINKSAIPLQ